VKNKDIRIVVAENIRRVAKRESFGLNELADVAGVSRSQLYNVLAGTSGASLSWLEQIANALDIQVWKLLKGR